MLAKRDGFLDWFKGFLILWVIHTHTVFWSGMGYVEEWARQFSLLIDVSIFFFISGYLAKPADFISSLKRSMRQFKNLYIDYLVLSCLLLLLLSIVYIFRSGTSPDLSLAILSMLRVEPIGELWEDIAVYSGSLWYVATYFSLLIVSPFVLHFFNFRGFRFFFLAVCFVLFAIASQLGWSNSFIFTQDIYIYCYLLIYFLGTAYRVDENNISTRNLKFSFLTNIALCLVVLFSFKDGILQLQGNKFPPNLIYLPYCCLAIQSFLVIKHFWKYSDSNPSAWRSFLEWCGRNSYFIFLFQGFVCSIPGYFLSALIRTGIPPVIIYLLVLSFNVFFTLLFTAGYIRIKKRFTDLLPRIATTPSGH